MNQIRIMELRGTYKGGGGPDKTILLSAAKHDKNRFFILVTYLRNPNDDDFQIGDMAKRMGVSDYIEVFDRSMFDVKCLFQLHSLAKKNNIQIIHIHDLKTTLLGFLLKVLNPRAKIMHTAHGWIINSQLDGLKQKLQLMKLLRRAELLQFQFMEKQLELLGKLIPKQLKIIKFAISQL